MNKIILLFYFVLSSFILLNGQVSISTSGATIDFNGYTGTGFSPTPSAGQLDSDGYSVEGMSNGDVNFGETGTMGDHARGISTGSESTGGFYAVDDGGNIFFGVQPGGSDFTPGLLTIRYVNNTGGVINSLNVSYDIKTRNDQDRSNSWNFSYSLDDSNYTPVSALDYISPSTSTGTAIITTSRTTTITNLSIPNNGFFYLQWNSNDVAGSGSRDELGIDDIIIRNVVLPVELSYFTAKQNKNSNTLTWQTASEQNNSHFDIQRSGNSKTWETIAKVTGAGTTDEVQDYSLTDKNPIAGINYYRLMQVDYDGAFDYSPIVSVDMGKEEQVSVYPNPVINQVVFEFDTKQKAGTILSIYHLNGQLVQTNTIKEDSSKIKLNVTDLAEGIYLMQVIQGDKQMITRFVKQ